LALAALARPRLGISVNVAQGSALDSEGARVTNVLEDGPAWNAGIREGDVITRVDGQSLFEPLPGDAEDDFDLNGSVPVQRLLAIARELEPGQEVNVTYVREGAERTTTISAEDLSGRRLGAVVPGFDAERLREQMRGLENLRELDGLRGFQWRSGEPGAPGAMFFGGPGTILGSARFGLELVPLNEGLGQYFGTTAGVLVVDAAESSTLGLQPGDVILSIGARPATTPAQVLRILGSYAGDEDIQIRVRRDGREIEVLGRLEG
jgi:S1-C subfamily serine protease